MLSLIHKTLFQQYTFMEQENHDSYQDELF